MKAPPSTLLRTHLKASAVRLQHDAHRVSLKIFEAWLAHSWRSSGSLLITMASVMATVVAASAAFVWSLKLVWTLGWPWLVIRFGSESEKQFIFAMGLMASCFFLVKSWQLMTYTLHRLFHYTEPHLNEAVDDVIHNPQAHDPLLHQKCNAWRGVLTANISRAEWLLARYLWNQERMIAANAHYLARRFPAIPPDEARSLKKPRM